MENMPSISGKSDYQRMVAEEWFTWKDQEIQESLRDARELVHQFNTTSANAYQERHSILQNLFGFLGKDSLIEPPFRCDLGKHIHIGNNTFVNYNCVFNDYGRIYIGDNVLIGFNVLLITSLHPIDPRQRQQKRNDRAQDIVIGDNVWIAAGTMILPGITIGNNSVIGAGSVVTRDVDENSLAVGNPCRVIRKL